MRRYATPGRLRVIGVLFLCVVAAVVAYTHQLVIPIFLGLLTWGKAWLKTLTPKLGLVLVKNSVFVQVRRILMQASAHIFVKSHKPWRRFITALRIAIIDSVKNIFAGYMRMPLWIRCSIAIAVLVATAGSSVAVFALLIVPQPVLDWLRVRTMTMLNRLGITKLFSALWNFAVPKAVRHRWHMYVKWTLGRRQVVAAQKLHETVVNRGQAGRAVGAKLRSQESGKEGG